MKTRCCAYMDAYVVQLVTAVVAGAVEGIDARTLVGCMVLVADSCFDLVVGDTVRRVCGRRRNSAVLAVVVIDVVVSWDVMWVRSVRLVSARMREVEGMSRDSGMRVGRVVCMVLADSGLVAGCHS